MSAATLTPRFGGETRQTKKLPYRYSRALASGAACQLRDVDASALAEAGKCLLDSDCARLLVECAGFINCIDQQPGEAASVGCRLIRNYCFVQAHFETFPSKEPESRSRGETHYFQSVPATLHELVAFPWARSIAR